MEVTKLYGKLSGLLSKGLNHEKLSFRMLERGDCVGVILLYYNKPKWAFLKKILLIVPVSEMRTAERKRIVCFKTMDWQRK